MPVDISPSYLVSHQPAYRRYNGPLEIRLKYLATSYNAIFRYSQKGVPHLVKLGEHQAYSIGHFVHADFWRVLYPYGKGGHQQRRDFVSAKEAFKFIEEEERKLHEVT